MIADIIHRRSHISQTSRRRRKALIADHRRYMRTRLSDIIADIYRELSLIKAWFTRVKQAQAQEQEKGKISLSGLFLRLCLLLRLLHTCEPGLKKYLH